MLGSAYEQTTATSTYDRPARHVTSPYTTARTAQGMDGLTLVVGPEPVDIEQEDSRPTSVPADLAAAIAEYGRMRAQREAEHEELMRRAVAAQAVAAATLRKSLAARAKRAETRVARTAVAGASA